MTNSELNEFLGGYDYQSEIVEKLETLQQTLEQAMQPFVPKYKDEGQTTIDEYELWGLQKRLDTFVEYSKLRWWVYDNVKDIYQREVLLYMIQWDFSHTQDDGLDFTVKLMATELGVSTSTIKRALRKLMELELVMRAPYNKGYELNKEQLK